MNKPDDILAEFPEPARQVLSQAWSNVSQPQREELLGWLPLMPASVRPMKDILSFVLDSWTPVVGTKERIAVVGPANVGKSTLFNQLVQKGEDRAAVSPVPGTTRENQEADAGLFSVVDTPGADAAGAVGARERETAFEAARSADFLVIVFEATRGIGRHDKELFDDLAMLGKPFIVVLNKIDLVNKGDRGRVLEGAATVLGLDQSQILDTVATDGTNVGRVILAIAKAEPKLLAAIGTALPEYRSRLAWQRIVPAAGAAAAVGLIPLPFADVIPLLGIQSGLVLSIARIYGFEVTFVRAKELIATFGIGFAARTVFHELAKFSGVPGWLLSAAIAASTTVTIGYASTVWFAEGERVSPQVLNKLMRDLSAYLRDQLKDLARKKPDEGTLVQRITQSLRELPEQLRPDALRKRNEGDSALSKEVGQAPKGAGQTAAPREEGQGGSVAVP
jgi:small GTP-binding protein